MNITFLVKKNHIFKRREKSYFNFFKAKSITTTGLYTSIQFRFEFNYLKILKKILKKKRFKQKYKKISRYWLMIKPNFILSMKSKNSRMGAGVGKYVRICTLILANKPIILFKKYSITRLKRIQEIIKKKFNLYFLVLIFKKKK